MEEKRSIDFITDGILSYGVTIGRFIFEEEKKIVFAITELLHVGPSDVYNYYQLSKEEYDELLMLSLPDEIPINEISCDKYYKTFLFGESAYCKRNKFTLKDVDNKLIIDK